jgi:hypothetical protein
VVVDYSHYFGVAVPCQRTTKDIVVHKSEFGQLKALARLGRTIQRQVVKGQQALLVQSNLRQESQQFPAQLDIFGRDVQKRYARLPRIVAAVRLERSEITIDKT